MPVPDFTYSARPSEADMRDLRPIKLGRRAQYLPPLYRYTAAAHPKCNSRRARRGHAKIVIYFIDPSPVGRRQWAHLNKNLHIPPGPTSNLHRVAPGLQKLIRGDYLFAWVLGTEGNAELDILQAFVTGRESDWDGPNWDDLWDNVQRCQEMMLGPRDERTPDKVHFENNPRLKAVNNSKRCYGIGEMVQTMRKIGAPAAHNKVWDDVVNEYQREIQQFLKGVMEIDMAGWEDSAPEDLQDDLKRYNELVNAPNIGCDSNYMWPSVQVNVARAQEWQSAASLTEEMGFFGGPHIDINDSPASFSVMACLSDIPSGKGWESGRFHLLAVGVYFDLDTFTLIYFTGRLRHGGTSPTAPRSYKMKGWEYRLVVIGYPSEKIQMGDVKHPLAALPFCEQPLFITPEMTGVSRLVPKPVNWTTQSNIAMDGQAIMRPRAQFQWYMRSLLQLNVMLLAQLQLADGLEDSDDDGNSSESRIMVDSEKFLQSVTLHRGGNEYRADNWALAPSGDVRSPATEEHFRVQERVMHTLYSHHGQAIHNARPAYNSAAPKTPKALGRPSKKRLRREHDDGGDGDDADSEGSEPESRKPKQRKKDSTKEKRRKVEPAKTDTNLVAQGGRTGASGAATTETVQGAGMIRRSHRGEDSTRSRSIPVVETEIVQNGPLDVIRAALAPWHSQTDNKLGNNGSHETLPTDLAFKHQADNVGSILSDDVTDTSGEPVASSLGTMIADFLDKFNEDALKRALQKVYRARDTLSTLSPGSICQVFAILNNVDVEAGQEHLSLRHMLQFCQATDELRTFCSTTDVWLNICKMRIMMSENFISRYLQQFCAAKLRDFLLDVNSVPLHWLEHLAVDVLKCVEHRTPIDIQSAKYLDATLLGAATYRPRRARPIVISREEAVDVTITHVLALLVDWFNLPDNFNTRARSYIVDCIMDAGLPGLLLLPDVWSIYESLPRWLFDNTKPRAKDTARRRVTFEPTYLDTFRDALCASSLAQRDSTEHLLVDSLRAAYRGLLGNAAEVTAPTTSHPTRNRLALIDSTFDPNQPLVTVTDRRAEALDRLLRFLRASLLVAEKNFNASAFDADQALHRELCSNADFLHPLRSLAPSCRRINGRVGTGITREYAQMDEGFFSVLVFRGVCFNTVAIRELSRDNLEVEFYDDQAFAVYLAFLEAVYPVESICNPQAMTKQPTGRCKDNYKEYWKAAKLSGWSKLFLQRDQVPFDEARRWLKKLKERHPLPGLGDLGLYLLLADLYDIGVVVMPSVEEMAAMIFFLKRGGLAGLRLLKYLSDEAVSKAAVLTAFTSFYADVELSLTARERACMVWNPITAEHSLCKFKRVTRQELI